jgi:hypothetical protein
MCISPSAQVNHKQAFQKLPGAQDSTPCPRSMDLTVELNSIRPDDLQLLWG